MDNERVSTYLLNIEFLNIKFLGNEQVRAGELQVCYRSAADSLTVRKHRC